MYLQFYNLREQPFGVTPNPAYLYPSRTHTEALASLSSGLKADRGFMALIAQPGMGKTTLLYQLLNEWRDSARTLFLFQTQCDSREFFRYVLAELGFEAEQMGLVAMHHQLNRVLFGEMLSSKRFILVVDEAQNLTVSVLETIRLLSNFEMEHSKLLQIVLAGQPQLAEKLAQPRLSQLRQRIAVLSRLEPLTSSEAAGYIEHRLQVAGYSGKPLFEPDALEVISQRSQGIPRNINNLCHNSLSLAHANGERTVTLGIVEKALSQLDVETLGQQSLGTTPHVAKPDPQGRSVEGFRRPPTPYLTYKPKADVRWARQVLGAIALISLLSLGGRLLFASFPNWWQTGKEMTGPALHTASPKPFAPQGLAGISRLEPATYPADPQDTATRQVLTVVARPGQTLEEISRLYVGHFDLRLEDEIRALNPELKKLNHLEAGQLILLPLPAGTLRKGLDTSEVVSASEDGNSHNLFAKIRAFIGIKKW